MSHWGMIMVPPAQSTSPFHCNKLILDTMSPVHGNWVESRVGVFSLLFHKYLHNFFLLCPLGLGSLKYLLPHHLQEEFATANLNSQLGFLIDIA